MAAVGHWQSDHGYRAALPTFCQFSCIRGFYSAAFETQNTLWYLHQVLELSAALPASMRLPLHFTEMVRDALIPFGLGTLRAAYPDKIPSFVLSPLACPGGPGSCSSYGNMSNDGPLLTVLRRLHACPPSSRVGCSLYCITLQGLSRCQSKITGVIHLHLCLLFFMMFLHLSLSLLQDSLILLPALVICSLSGGTVSHGSYGELGSLGLPLPFGGIGQELTGAGAAFNGELLARIYGSIESIHLVGMQAIAATVQLHPRLASASPGSNVTFSVHPQLTVSCPY